MPRPPLPPQLRFDTKVLRTDGCWLWTAGKSGNGYGAFKLKDGSQVPAHRMAWELARGPIPDGLYVLHRCDNRQCVRPEHLFLGSARDNALDMMAKGRHGTAGKGNQRIRSSNCRAGHPREGNIRYKAGYPVCRECANEQAKRWRQKQQHHHHAAPQP